LIQLEKVRSAETREKLGVHATRRFKGISKTEEHKNNMRHSHVITKSWPKKLPGSCSGEKNHNFGNCGDKNPLFGKKHSSEYKNNQSVAIKKWWASRKVA